MAKVSMPATSRTAYTAPVLTAPGGLVQRGGYLGGTARGINILSRPRINFPIKSSAVGSKEPALPKGMD